MAILYTRNQCAACEQVKALFAERGIEYEVVNIQEDYSAAAKLVQDGIRSVPVYERGNGERFVGAKSIVGAL